MKKSANIFWTVMAVLAALFLSSRIIAPVSPNQNQGKNQEGGLVEMQTIKLYYYNPEADKDGSGNVMCSRAGLVPVEREIPLAITPIRDAINLLMEGGVTESEKAAGITTEFPLSGLKLAGADLDGGVLTLEFGDPRNKTSGGACRAAILWLQIEATAKQFDGVNEARFIPETLFQP